MKRILLICSVMLFAAACSENSQKPKQLTTTVSSGNPNDHAVVEKIDSAHYSQIVATVEKKGIRVKRDGVPCDYEYKFIDSAGNEERFVTNHERDGRYDPNAPCAVIGVEVSGKDGGCGYVVYPTVVLASDDSRKQQVMGSLCALLK